MSIHDRQTLLIKYRTIPTPSRCCTESPSPPQFMEGPGLAYVAFSQVISLFPGTSFWAIIFFLALATMGLGTIIMLLEGILFALQKRIPVFSKHLKLLSGTGPPARNLPHPHRVPRIQRSRGPPAHGPQYSPVHFHP